MSSAEYGATATRLLTNAISGSIYIAKSQDSSSKNAVLVYAPKFLKLERTITDGIKGGFTGTQGLSVDASGNLYVISYPTNSISVYAPGKASPSYIITKGIEDPFGMAFDSKGDLYVLNCPNCVHYNHQSHDQGSVVVYPAGKSTPSRTVTSGIHNPISAALSHDDSLYVANCTTQGDPRICTANYYNKPGGGTVTVYPSGADKPKFTITNGIDAPRTVAVDSSGRLYVANLGDSEIAVYDSGATTPSYDILLGIFDGVFPASMVFDSSGDLYVASCAFGATGRICVFPPGSGNAVAYLQSPENYFPRILAFDSAGNLYALELGIDVIRSGPNHSGHIAVALYPPGSGTAGKVVDTGSNSATAMAVSR